jgi:hypothetical protein
MLNPLKEVPISAHQCPSVISLTGIWRKINCNDVNKRYIIVKISLNVKCKKIRCPQSLLTLFAYVRVVGVTVYAYPATSRVHRRAMDSIGWFPWWWLRPACVIVGSAAIHPFPANVETPWSGAKWQRQIFAIQTNPCVLTKKSSPPIIGDVTLQIKQPAGAKTITRHNRAFSATLAPR